MTERDHAAHAGDAITHLEKPDIRVFQTAEALAHEAAEWLCALAQASVGAFAICLSGGSTPRPLYERLATPAIAARFPWRRVHWFWGDERFVPHDHPDSNYRMVHQALFSQVPVPEANIHAIPTVGLTPEQAATAYETTLKEFYGADALDPRQPLFDVTLLGIGEDGHTASLFPGQPALRERRRWVVAVEGGAVGAEDHPDLSGTRQQFPHRLSRDRRGETRSRGTRNGRGPRDTGGSGETRRAAPLVHRSPRVGERSELMSANHSATARRPPTSVAVVIVMGVSGSGKSTVGGLLASRLHWEFEDADWFHPASNIEKMHQGIPLTDEDRGPWLDAIADLDRRDATVDPTWCHRMLRAEAALSRCTDRRPRRRPARLSQG